MIKIAIACAAATLAIHAAPATAQSYSGTLASAYFTSSKTQAILGGQSRLAAVLAQQSGEPVPQTAAFTTAGYSVTAMQAVMPIYRPAISPDRPDVFNSVALPINRTPLDRRWRKVVNGPVGAASAAFAASLSTLDPIERLETINRYVNRRVSFVDDSRQYGVADYWTSAAETLRRGRGDCEDYAIAKLQLLRRAGFAEDDLYLVVLRDALRRADHAVLVVRSEGRMLVLDNGTDRLVDSYEMPDYRPILTFSGNRAWTHGYRRTQPPPVYAWNEAAQPTVTLAAASLAPSAGAIAN